MSSVTDWKANVCSAEEIIAPLRYQIAKKTD
jgi:hypothetical protein